MKRINRIHRYMNIILSSWKAMLLTVFFVAVCAEANAQQVTFSVNMEHVFLEPGDQVVVRGNVATLGNWEAPGELRLRKQGNTSIYTAKLDLRKEGSEPILYKFVILRSNGTAQWEQRGNRQLNRSSSEPVWFDDRNMPGIAQTVVQVTFQLDLSEHSMDGLPVQAVALMGARTPLSFDLETGRTEMEQTSDGIWETTVAFPFGTSHDVPFKFAWKQHDEWMWEWRPGHTNHVFMIDDSGTQQVIKLRYDMGKPGIVPIKGTSGQVDDYDVVIVRLGELGTQSRYMYEKAMQQLTSGQMESAETTYAIYKAAHPGGEEIDDFEYRMVYEINKSRGYEAANIYLQNRKQAETIPERIAYFEYLEGELALNASKRAQARKTFQKVLHQNKWDIATKYSEQALVHSYITESDPDSIKKGVHLLEQHAARASQAERRNYKTQLVRAYRAAGMKEKQEQALIALASMGSERQRAGSKIELAQNFLRNEKFTEALGFLDAVNEGALPKRDKIKKMRLQIELYHQLEMYSELATLYDVYMRKYPDDPHQKRLGKLEKNARVHLGSEWVIPEGERGIVFPDSTQNGGNK